MAAFLAIIMILGVAPQLTTGLQASAGMEISLSGALVAEGEITPRYRAGAAVDGQATLSWTIPNVDEMDRLVFPLRRPNPAGGYFHDIGVMHFLRMDENEMWVEYRVFGESNADLTGDFADERTALWTNFRINYGTPGPEPDPRYLLHNHQYWINHMNLIDPIVTPPAVFNPNRIASTMRPLVTNDPSYNRPFGGPIHEIISPPAVPPVDMGPAQPPFFRVQRGGGFSFSLQPGTAVDPSAAHNVHFAWDTEQDPAGNTFIVTTGGLREGAFYDFVLSRSPAGTIDFEDPNDVVWHDPPSMVTPPFPEASPTNPLVLYRVNTTEVERRRAFTGFHLSTVPLAHHRDEERTVQPWTVGRTNHFDQLWWQPIAPWGPTDGISRDFLEGFTNWDLPAAPRPTMPTVMDVLWNPWNLLDQTHPVHSDDNDFLPGFASTRALELIEDPQYDAPSNMLRLRIELPYEFFSDVVAGVTVQEWRRIDPTASHTDFTNPALSFTVNIDLLIPPNIPNSFSMNNIFGSPVRTDTGNAPFIATDRTNWLPYFDEATGDRIGTDIYIMGLEPSRVFPNFDLQLLPGAMSLLRPGMADVVKGDTFGGGSRFPVRNVHTFLEFDVVFIGGRFHVRIFPFRDAHGDYTVISNSNVMAPHRSGGRDVLFIPLEPDATSHIQVRFEPSMPAMDALYSQVMVFVPVSDRHIFTEPANFVLHPDNPPLTFLEPSNTNEAVFSVDVGWDLATVGQMDEYFDEVNQIRGPWNSFPTQPAPWTPPRGAIHIDPSHPDYLDFIADGGVSGEWFLPYNELIFTYLLHSRLSPWDAQGEPFVYIDVAIRRIYDNGWFFEWDYTLREIVTPPIFQVLAPTPPTTAVPVPTALYVTVSSASAASAGHSVILLDQFGQQMPMPTGSNVEWSLSNVVSGTSDIDAATGTVTPGNLSTYAVAATFTYGALTLHRSLTVENAHTLVAPTAVNVTAPYNIAFQGATREFNTVGFPASVVPAGALQNIRWEVTDLTGNSVPGAAITQNGVLFVSFDVEPGTQLRVRAVSTSLGTTTPPYDRIVTVAASQRSQAITTVTMSDMMRIGVGPSGQPGGGIRLNMVASRQGETTPPLPHFFRFPEIYHITSQLININANQSGNEPIMPPLPESNSQPMTLDHPEDPDFPPPQNLRAWVTESDEHDDDIYGGFFDIGFDVPLARMRHYLETSPRRGADTSITIRVFMSESQQAIQNITGLAGAARSAAATNIDLGAIGNGAHQLLGPFSDGGNLDALRAGVVYFDVPLSSALLHSDQQTMEQIFKLHGLDRNTRYYVTVDAFVDWATVPVHTSYSTTTNIAGVTTMGDLVPPDPGGMRPSAPRDLRVDDYTVSSADLSWLPVAPLTPEGGQIRYQILRMRADQLPNELLDSRDNHMAAVLSEIASLGLSAPEAVLITYGDDEVHDYATGNAAHGFNLRHGTLTDDPADTEERVILQDNNLSPNTLYFYYVRTVWHTPEGMTYSAWVGVSVTTSLVDPPINLRIELAPWIGGALWTDFDPRHQFVIRFDAPVGSLDGHGELYDFQYALMTGGALWEPHIRLTTAMLLERIPTPGQEGFYQFTYLISDLQPGTQYSIRVRTMDLVNGDYSMYSNIATTRTDTDQDTINRDRDLGNLHQYLRDLLAEFIRRHYWTAQDSHNMFTAVYRPSMVNNLLETNDSMIRLAMTGQDMNVYYLPQSLFLQTWRSEQGFIIAKGDVEIAIPSHAFNNIDSEAILQAQQRVRDVPGVLDWYVRITAVMRDHAENTQIHGRDPVGYEVILSFEVVEANVTAAQLDRDILDVLTHRLNTDYYTAPFVEEINQMLDREESYEDMVRRLRQIADIIMNQMAAYVNSQLLPTLDRVYEVNYVQRPITIRLINQATTAVVNGFRFAGTNWVQQEVNIQGRMRAMRTSGPGAFAFNIQNLNLPGVSQMQGNQTLTELFVRYGLHDFLGTDAAFNLQNNITLQQVQGVAARLAGAPHAANPQNWLRGQGYIVPVRGANSNATTQEAIYTLMAMYEIRSNTNMRTLRISNFNSASGLNGVDVRFRPAIQAAFELNLYTNANMNPTAPITIEDVLRMILAINQRVTL